MGGNVDVSRIRLVFLIACHCMWSKTIMQLCMIDVPYSRAHLHYNLAIYSSNFRLPRAIAG